MDSETTSKRFFRFEAIESDIDPLGRTTTYAVDALGRRTSLTLDGRSEQWAYRPDGVLAGYMDFAGRVTSFGYSPDGELTAIDYPAGTADVSYGYDLAGNVVSMSDGLGVTTYSYNVLGQMASRSRNGRTVSYAYTLNGQVGQIGYWNRGSVQVGYDAAGRLTGLAPWGASATSYAYRSTGLLAGETRPNGVNTAYAYDTVSRLTGVNGIGYVLDANGNRIQMSDWEGVTTYSYDALDRLAQAIYPTSTVTYTLDSVGNRLSDGMVSFAYDPSDRITNPGYTYDANGNLLADGTASYEYDAANRLIQMTRNGVVTTYGYDGWGNLIQETVNGVTTEFVLDENAAYTRILGEVRSDGGERLYAYGPEGFAAQLIVGGNVEYPLLDGLGSVRQLTDASGNVILSRGYDAFGSVRYAIGGGVTRLGYTGEMQDSASGLVYLRARHYQPVIGRFLQRDTFGGFVRRPQSLNRYAYAEGNPIVYVDPSGHCPAPPKSSGNVICVAGFIPTKESEGGPWGSIIYQGDDRDFSPDSTGRSSRFYAWIDADTGQFIGEPYVHPTVLLRMQLLWWIFPWCLETQPREWNNYFYVHKQADGIIYFTYSVVCSSPACYAAPGPEGEILFAPNHYGSYDTYGSVEAFPNLEAYHWQNGRLVSSYLFQLQNFSPGEIGNDMAGFGTGANMYDLWPWGHRDFESHTVKQFGKWTVATHVE